MRACNKICSRCSILGPIKLLLKLLSFDVKGNQGTVGQETGLAWIEGKLLFFLFTWEPVMLCSTSTAIHLCADNRPWKENYNQSRGRKEGTAHPLQPNILIYKETIKYFKSKVASQPVHCDWIEEFLLIIFLPQIPPMLFSFFSSQSLNCPYFTTLVLFPVSLSLSLSFFLASLAPLLIFFTFAFLSFSALPATVNFVVVNR